MNCVVHRCGFSQVGRGTDAISFFFSGQPKATGNTIRKVGLFPSQILPYNGFWCFLVQESGPIRNGLSNMNFRITPNFVCLAPPQYTGGRYPPVAQGCHNVEFEHIVQGQPPLQPCVNLVQGTKRPQGGEKVMWPNVDASLDLGHGGYKVRKGSTL